VVTRGEPLRLEVAWGADLLDDDEVVLTSARHVVEDGVRQLQHERVERGAGLVRGRLRVFDLSGQLLRTGQKLLLLVAARLRDQRAELLLLGPEPLERRDRAAPRPVRGQELVDELRRLATSLLSTTETVGVGAEQLRIDHPHSLSSPATALRVVSRRRGRPGRQTCAHDTMRT